MRRTLAMALTLLALTGCAAQHRPVGELAVKPEPRTIVRIEVTNDLGQSIDLYTSAGFLGTVAAGAHASYEVPPTTERFPIYAQWTHNKLFERFNISNSRLVHFVYDEPPARM